MYGHLSMDVQLQIYTTEGLEMSANYQFTRGMDHADCGRICSDIKGIKCAVRASDNQCEVNLTKIINKTFEIID